jgi:hypothetical protein
LKILVLIVVLLAAPNIIEPAYAPLTTAFKSTSDCNISSGANTRTPIVLQCRITPSDNGYVDNLLPTKSFGGSGVLIVENVPSVPVAKNYAFMKFNMVGNLPPGLLQSGARPENASLQMYVRLMNFFYNATVEINRASTGNWSENTLTWNTMPELDPANYVSLNIMQNGTWAQWNVMGLAPPISNSSSQMAFAAISSETNWKNLIWFDSDEYPFTNGNTSPSLDLTFVEPYITIETPYPGIPISVGSNTLLTDSDGKVKLLLPWGNYPVTVPDTISISNGTRAQFVGWSDRVNGSSRVIHLGNNVTVSANYVTQHDLTASSPYGTVSGAGWYFENTEATLSVNPTSVPVEGVEGWFGVRYVFDHWAGACTESSPACSVLMNRPEYAQAVWRVDWSDTALGLSILLISAVLLTIAEKRRKTRRLTKTRKKRTDGSLRSQRNRRTARTSAGRKKRS